MEFRKIWILSELWASPCILWDAWFDMAVKQCGPQIHWHWHWQAEFLESLCLICVVIPYDCFQKGIWHSSIASPMVNLSEREKSLVGWFNEKNASKNLWPFLLQILISKKNLGKCCQFYQYDGQKSFIFEIRNTLL